MSVDEASGTVWRDEDFSPQIFLGGGHQWLIFPGETLGEPDCQSLC
jgi:hypothetical protein